MTETFKLKSDYIELVKLLKVTGLCATGGEAKLVTADGLVQVDGQTELRKKCKIRSGQTVGYQDHIISVE